MNSTFFRLRVPKSETRELADQEIAERAKTEAWRMRTSTFFVAFIVIAAVLAIVALLSS